jgi:hypothetical protein
VAIAPRLERPTHHQIKEIFRRRRWHVLCESIRTCSGIISYLEAFMHKSWTVALLIVPMVLFSPMRVRAQSLGEFGISSSDFIRPDPPERSKPPKPKIDVEVEGPAPMPPPNPQRRKALLWTAAGIGFAGLGLEVGALFTVIVAYGSMAWTSFVLSFTCHEFYLDEESMTHRVTNPCPEEREVMANDFERRQDIARKISIAGMATLGAGGIVALSTILATARHQPANSAKPSEKLTSIQPTLSFDSNSFLVGLSMPL